MDRIRLVQRELHGSSVYYLVERGLTDGRPEFDIRRTPIAGGEATSIATIPASRVPSWQVENPSLSPDGRWIAVLLTDAFTTNIWKLSTETRQWQQVTDFGDRPVFIARRVSWSADGKTIVAAIAEGDADVVLLDGLVEGAARTGRR